MLENKIKAAVRNIPDFPKKGIQFKDITPLLLDVDLMQEITEALVEHARKLEVDIVCGIESRGFIFGGIIAQQLGVPFVLIRKKGKLPGNTIAYSYNLEYGSATIEMHRADLPEGSKVLIHDDLLATGGTASAAGNLIKRSGSSVVGYSFLVNLGFLNGADKLTGISNDILSLATY